MPLEGSFRGPTGLVEEPGPLQALLLALVLYKGRYKALVNDPGSLQGP